MVVVVMVEVAEVIVVVVVQVLVAMIDAISLTMLEKCQAISRPQGRITKLEQRVMLGHGPQRLPLGPAKSDDLFRSAFRRLISISFI